MKIRIGIVSSIAVSVAAAAWSHGGATGIVKERMDGMSAMSRIVKELTPMMRGKIEYDAAQVRASADAMIEHSGEQMTSLFPEGTGDKPSAALPAVWEDWEDFAALAEELKAFAEGLKVAASNGLAESGSASSANSMMGGGTTNMMGGGTNNMMGGEMMGTSNRITTEMFEEMPANMAFNAVAQTCSACHQKFRAEEN